MSQFGRACRLRGRGIACLFLASSAQGGLFTEKQGANENSSITLAAALLPYTFPVGLPGKSAVEAQISPAFATYSGVDLTNHRSERVDAVSGAAGATYGFGENLALNVTGIDFHSTSGSFEDPTTGIDGAVSDSGWIASGNLLYDPIRSDRLGLPMVAGYNDESLVSQFSGGEGRESLQSPGVTAGIGVRLRTGRYFEIEPFFMILHPFNHGLAYSGASNCGNSCGGGPATTGVVGLNAVLIPYHLSLFYSPPTGAQSGASVYALRWIKTFGGRRAKAAPIAGNKTETAPPSPPSRKAPLP